MPRTTDRFSSGVHQRTEIAKFDHDCPGGHGPRWWPFDVVVEEQWVDLEGRPINDPEHIAVLEKHRQKGER
ncbi:MAG: hypothetical protein HYX53_02960 [Chloroflexi bacterium]|nr:hypothetical protein [Chloroflexota bacterium]